MFILQQALLQCVSRLLPSNEEVNQLSDACEDPRAKWMVQVPGATARVLKGKVYLPRCLVGLRPSIVPRKGHFGTQLPATMLCSTSMPRQ